METTEDGKSVILGTVDGCVTVLVIADPAKPEMQEYLSSLPSRNEEVISILIFKVGKWCDNLCFNFQAARRDRQRCHAFYFKAAAKMVALAHRAQNAAAGDNQNSPQHIIKGRQGQIEASDEKIEEWINWLNNYGTQCQSLFIIWPD